MYYVLCRYTSQTNHPYIPPFRLSTPHNEDTMKHLYDSDTAERLTAKQLGITRDQYDAVIGMSEGVPGEGHVRPGCLRDTKHPRVYAA